LTFLGYSLTFFSSKKEKTMQVITKSAFTAILFSVAFTAQISASNEPIIVSQPNNITQCVGGTEVLKVAISANLSAVYQWQQSSDNANWAHINGANQATYTPESQNVGKMWYRVLITTQGENSRAVASNSAEVKIAEPTKISIETISSKSLESSVSFKATYSGGVGIRSLQWQKSENGISWTNIEGATSDVFTTPVSVGSPARYKVVSKCTGSGCCN
jgi:large repetitive protein